MFKSYIDGSNCFLDALQNELPVVAEALKMMDDTEESVFKTAEVIGGYDLLSKIKNFTT